VTTLKLNLTKEIKMNKMYLIIINVAIIFLHSTTSYTQNFGNSSNKNFNRFNRVDALVLDHLDSINYYPNNIGDFWEYIVRDTTTLLGQFYAGLNFSMTKEVMNDTLMPNGKIYKKIKWENIANSVSYSPWFEYHRVDSTGNVFLYYDNQDYILFDFSLSVGQTYSSHIINHIWKISNRYNVIGFGDTVQVIDYELLENGNLLKEKYTVAEKFGIIYYQKNIHEYAVPEGNFWGAVINGVEYGTLIVKKQTVDWKEFYPLHIGDYWVYEGQSGSIHTLSSKRIVSDTLLSDGYIYYKSISSDYTFGYTSYSYERIDTLGRIFYWEYWDNKFRSTITISNIVGDTIPNNLSMNSSNRVNDKYISRITEKEEIHFFLYPDIAFSGQDYDRFYGLIRTTADLAWSELRGCFINGILWGDTILTDVNEYYSLNQIEFKLFPCYPNPFNSVTTIKFNVSKTSHISLNIYDLLGREVRTLINEQKPDGEYLVNFDANNLSSGIYIYILNADGYSLSRKLILLK
jgi:hypothetical protein